MYINENFLKLQAGYLFPEIGRRVAAYQAENASADIIKLGIGDVTRPLPEACRTAMVKAVNDLGKEETFVGYGPEKGHAFLREIIVENDYSALGCAIAADEIFVSDGSKCDCGNVLDILGEGNVIAVPDPVYPVYVDTNVMAGYTGQADAQGEYRGLHYLRMTSDNDFQAELPTTPVDIIYLCYPNNPTGAVASFEYLKQWVDYANTHGALILFDAAYRDFIVDDNIPKSIYQIPGADTCAIETRSFSKNAGFTGVRCGFVVVPKALKGKTKSGEAVELWSLWNRRQSTKFNGASYIVQRGAAAVYSDDGKAQCQALVDYYLANASYIRECLERANVQCFGGVHAPYVWVRCPQGMTSWDMFDALLKQANVVVTPGSGFGQSGEGYFRISAFGDANRVKEAMQRVVRVLAKQG